MYLKLMMKKKMIRWTLSVLLGGSLFGLGLVPAQAQPTETNSPPAQTNSSASSAQTPEVAKSMPKHRAPAVKHQLTGAELYSINCERCHQERYPTERTGAQWKTIMLHMQVRANIPPSQARLILQFLQENSGR